ncbi:MAG: hypothetical protein R8J84_04280 [Mariprofundales bacterium]
MIRILATLSLSVAVLLAAAGNAAAGIKVDAAGVSAELRGVPVRAALTQLATVVGVDLYFDKTIKGRISAEFQHLSLQNALTRMLRQQSFALSYDKEGRPQSVWLLKKGSISFDVVRGYHDPTAASLAPAIPSTDGGSLTSSAVTPSDGLPSKLIHTPAGVALVRSGVLGAQQAQSATGWHWQAANSQIQQQKVQLRRQLANAKPEDRPAIAKQIVQLAQRQSIEKARTTTRSLQDRRDLVRLTKLKNRVKLPNQAQALQQQQQTLRVASVRQQALRRNASRSQNQSRSYRKQPSSSWVVR